MEAQIPVASTRMWFLTLANMSASPVNFDNPWWVGRVVYSSYKNTNAFIENRALPKGFHSFNSIPCLQSLLCMQRIAVMKVSLKWFGQFRFCVGRKNHKCLYLVRSTETYVFGWGCKQNTILESSQGLHIGENRDGWKFFWGGGAKLSQALHWLRESHTSVMHTSTLTRLHFLSFSVANERQWPSSEITGNTSGDPTRPQLQLGSSNAGGHRA